MPSLPLNPVKTTVADFESLVRRARGGPEPAVPVYVFGAGQKKFLDRYNESDNWGREMPENE